MRLGESSSSSVMVTLELLETIVSIPEAQHQPVEFAFTKRVLGKNTTMEEYFQASWFHLYS